jgi:hypothetical protein
MPQPDAPLDLVYVVGVGRSGSTLLDIALGNHPQIESVGELRQLLVGGWRANTYCTCRRRVWDCDFWTRVDAEWRRRVPEADVDTVAEDLTDLLALRRFRRWDAMVGSEQATGSLRRQLGGLYRAIAQESDTRILVDSSKSPGLGLLVGTLPGIRVSYIHLTRDGRGVARSFKKSFAKDEAGGVPKRVPGRSIWRASAVWLLTNRLAERTVGKVPEDRSVRVRYEDFVGDCVATMERIGAMLDLDMSDLGRAIAAGEGLAVGHNIGGNKMRMSEEVRLRAVPDEWRTGLTAFDRTVFQSICGSMLKRYGYIQPPGAPVGDESERP